MIWPIELRKLSPGREHVLRPPQASGRSGASTAERGRKRTRIAGIAIAGTTKSCKVDVGTAIAGLIKSAAVKTTNAVTATAVVTAVATTGAVHCSRCCC